MGLIKMNNKKLVFIITFCVVVLCLVSIKVGKIMDIYSTNVTTFYVHAENKKWMDEAKINMLGDSLNKMIYPGQTGRYKLSVKNNQLETANYMISFSVNTNIDIQMKYRFRSESDYIMGLNNEWKDISELSGEYTAFKNNTDNYVLEWKFADNYEPTQGGFYTLTIRIINK